MPLAKDKFTKPSLLTLFTREQAEANLELLRQELKGMRHGANLFFSGFTIPPKGGKPAQYREWLLPTEEFDDLKPEQVDYVLKNLEWFKAEIARKQKLFDDDIPYAS